MTLKSIELIGFKSFGRKSNVVFTSPITAIVGPNGSGKSNIVEAIRFVLGEQSMKSLRGKGGSDLIYKGSKTLSSLNRASVTMTFDNRNKNFSFTNSGLGVSIDYDEIIISREVFNDGANKYSINGTEVRLKDIIDLLASVNIGTSRHHIISQGEADGVLSASNKERRGMIEDALGLKVYQYRIRESERKIEKTTINMKEVQTLRREIAPHLAFLKKQVQVVEKSRLMKDELRDLYKTYLSTTSFFIKNETNRLLHLRRVLDERSVSLDERIGLLQKNKVEDKVESENSKQIKVYEQELYALRAKRDEKSHSLGRIEGTIEGVERHFSRKPEAKGKVVSEQELKSFVENLQNSIDEAINGGDLPSVIEILKNIKSKISEFLPSNDQTEEKSFSLEDNEEYRELQNTKNEVIRAIDEIREEEKKISVLIEELKQKEREVEYSLRDSERMLYELMREKNEVVSDLHSLKFEDEKLLNIKNIFDSDLAEAAVLIGRDAISYAQMQPEGEVPKFSNDEIRRKIERIKIKLEDIGSGSGSDVMKEYESTQERDLFLAKELNDLNKSIEALHVLIQDLKETLDKEFKNGVEKINKQFHEFFKLMFGGGSAFLSVTMEHKKQKKDNEISDEALEESGDGDEPKENIELGFERGIEINITLPQKKVKDLNMLSGGERSLTSIALLFAISQVNPPPFLVLDETDAALDEANSKKYGNMLESLSKYSQLMVVTHNRETMSRANVLYGVTMSSEGVSKLLSIHLEDATSYAK